MTRSNITSITPRIDKRKQASVVIAGAMATIEDSVATTLGHTERLGFNLGNTTNSVKGDVFDIISSHLGHAEIYLNERVVRSLADECYEAVIAKLDGKLNPS